MGCTLDLCIADDDEPSHVSWHPCAYIPSLVKSSGSYGLKVEWMISRQLLRVTLVVQRITRHAGIKQLFRDQRCPASFASHRTLGASYIQLAIPSIIFRMTPEPIASSVTGFPVVSCNSRAAAETLRCGGSSASSLGTGEREAVFVPVSRSVSALYVGRRNVPVVSGPLI